MAYIPMEWAMGDVITAEKLNKVENGIETNSKLVYLVTAEVPLDADEPVITQGNFEDACAVVEAGGIVVITLTIEGSGTFHYYSTQYFSGESAAIDLFTVSAQGSSLRMTGFEWKTGGLYPWPLE